MARRGQTAIEYLFMLMAVLFLVLIAFRTISSSMQSLNTAVSNYVDTVRKQLLENV
ncbi:class III signal peptide-containing protein [Thermococcus sp.]